MSEQAKISSIQKSSSLATAAFGSVFLIMGGGMSIIALPDALRKGEYGALVLLLFVLVGVGFIAFAFKNWLAYKKFGPSPLLLNPQSPGVGGQLGGQFDVHITGTGHAMASSTPMMARLTCTHKRKSGKHTDRRIEWQQEIPVLVDMTATGIRGTFVFDIHDNCRPTEEINHRESYKWDVAVEGDFSFIGKGEFKRSWPVVVEHENATKKSDLRIPQNFIDDAEERSEDRAKQSVLTDILVSEDAQSVTIVSQAGRNPIFKLFGILMGAVFLGIGVLIVKDGGWAGYLIGAAGSLMAFFSLRSLGRSMIAIIDKGARTIQVKYKWCGIRYARFEGKVTDEDQFRTKLTSTSTSGSKVTEFHLLEFAAVGKTLRIADGIAGKLEANALRQSIVERLF